MKRLRQNYADFRDTLIDSRKVAFLCILAACAIVASVHAEASETTPTWTSTNAGSDVAACMPEIYAYARVEELAIDLGQNPDVFGDALKDLREQLFDCLAVSAAPPNQSQHASAARPPSMPARGTSTL